MAEYECVVHPNPTGNVNVAYLQSGSVMPDVKSKNAGKTRQDIDRESEKNSMNEVNNRLKWMIVTISLIGSIVIIILLILIGLLYQKTSKHSSEIEEIVQRQRNHELNGEYWNSTLTDQKQEIVKMQRNHKLNGQHWNSTLTHQKQELTTVNYSVLFMNELNTEKLSNLNTTLRKALTDEIHQWVREFHYRKEGWYNASNHYWYKIFQSGGTFNTAKLACEKMGARLASTGIREIRNEIYGGLRSSFLREVWIGLDDISQEGRWVWSDGVVATRSNTPWRSDQPNGGAGEDCAFITTETSILDSACSFNTAYICELFL